jgi:hypothetical protein
LLPAGLSLGALLGCLSLARPDCREQGCSSEGYQCNEQTGLCELPAPLLEVALENEPAPASDAVAQEAGLGARRGGAAADAADAVPVPLVDGSSSCVAGERRSCETAYPANTGCRAGTETCQPSADGQSTDWGACQSDTAPALRNCADSSDNDCDGLADNTLDAVCQCVPGSQRACGRATCRGLQSCRISEDGSSSAWEECTPPTFGEPRALLGLGFAEQDVWGPALSADGRTLFVSTGVPEDLFVATRVDRGRTFGPLSAIVELNTPEPEGTPFLSADGLTLYFFGIRAGGGDRDLWLARRASPSAAFGAAVLLGGINSPEPDQKPWLSADELTLVFDSTRPSRFAATNLWLATRASRDVDFGTPSELPGINSDAIEEGPTLSADQLEVYFVSDRPGSAGGLDIWGAQRERVDEPFGEPSPIESVNSPLDDLDLALSSDGQELFFSSARSEGLQQIYHASRTCQ